eukprot:g34099.t1
MSTPSTPSKTDPLLTKIKHAEASTESKTILVLVDGSPQSDYAFEQAVRWKREGDRLYVLHSVQTEVPSGTSILFHTADPTEIVKHNKDTEEHGHEVIQKYDKLCTAAKVKNVEVETVTSLDAKEAALKFAKEKKVNMIYTGCRGLGMIQRMYMGSFSQYIVEHAPCDVLVVKHPELDKGKKKAGDSATSSPTKAAA